MKNKIIALIFGIFVFAGVLFLYTNNRKSLQTNEKILVGTSFYPMYYFASQIGGDKVNVYNITPAASEPHDYEPTTQDMVKINMSRMLILNGGQLEPWGSRIKDQLKNTQVLIVVAGEGLSNKKFEEEGKIAQDPHVWLDPVLAKTQVENIERGFEKIDPANAKYYESNARKLYSKLDQLHKEYKVGLSSCAKKDFVTSHAAFSYLAGAYKINQVAISGISPDEEPSPTKLAEVAHIVRKQNIKIIFFESLISPKLSNAIANETGAKTAVLDPIEGIAKEDAAKGEDYISVMRQNLNVLKEALECNK